MQVKKSINLKDLIPDLEYNKSFSYSIEPNMKKDEEEENINNLQRRYSLRYQQQQEKQHEFLAKMRPRYRSKYTRESNREKIEELRKQENDQPHKNIQIVQQCKDTLGCEEKQKVTMGRITNFTPFNSIQNYDKYESKILLTSPHVCENKQFRKIKIRSNKSYTPKSFKNSTTKYLTTTNDREQHTSLDKYHRNSAKIVLINPEISKTRLFDKEQDQISNKSLTHSLKMSPYQLAVKKKTINLIQKKLKSLGKQADDYQINQFEEVAKILFDAEAKKKCQNLLKVKQHTLEHNPIKVIDKYRNNQYRNIQNNVATDLNRYLKMQIKQSEFHLDVASKTIQIRENPRINVKNPRTRSQLRIAKKLHESYSPIRESRIDGFTPEVNLNHSAFSYNKS